MSDQGPPDQTVGQAPAEEALDAGLAAAFGPDSGPPLPAGGSVLQRLSATMPAVPQVQLRDPDSGVNSPVVRPRSEEMPPAGSGLERYQLHGEIARGGMGAVLKGRDVDLRRDIAVKVLLETHQGKTELLQRFVEEAQIAGQLQHPGVVPVYELGQFPDRRPYFTMKLVKGQTLAKLLEQRSGPHQDRASLLKVFEQACQTLAYAHARGVIHRDLKPSNIMVGAFGEVQVMDWGLAKVLAGGGIADEKKTLQRQQVSVIRTERSQQATPEVGSQTQAGSVLGTPAYMAPEQARGDLDLVDERADVFGLGAILCEILTGQPPFTGRGAEAQRKAQTAQLDDAFGRLDHSGADAELVGLAKRCLAAEPWDRPRQAGDVVAAVTAYQRSVAERLRQAELERAAAEARTAEEARTREMAEARAREEHRRRRLTVALAAVLMALLAIVGSGAAWWWQESTAIIRDVEAALMASAEHGQAGRWPEARATLERAEAHLSTLAPAGLRNRVRQARADLDMVAALENIRLSLAETKKLDPDYGGTAARYADAFRDYGIAVETLETADAASRVRQSSIHEPLVAALDHWCQLHLPRARTKKLQAVVQAADDSAWRRSLRTAAQTGDKKALLDLAQREETWKQPPHHLHWLGGQLAAANLPDQAATLLRQAQRRYPGDFWINYELARLLFHLVHPVQPKAAAGYLRVAVAIRPASGPAHNALAVTLMITDPEESLAEMRQSLVVDPDNYLTHWLLGMMLLDRHNLKAAQEELQASRRLRPEWFGSHIGLGEVLRQQGKLAEAAAAYRQVLTMNLDSLHLTAEQKDNMKALARAGLGEIFVDQKDLLAAIREYQLAVKLQPTDAYLRAMLGRVLLKQGNTDDAIVSLRRAIQLEPDQVDAYANLGVALVRKNDWNGAIVAYNRALALMPQDAGIHFRLAYALDGKHDLDGAIAEYRQTIALDPKLFAAHLNLGRDLLARDDVQGALAAAHAAQALRPKDVDVALLLKAVFIKRGQLEEARLAWKKAIDQNPPYHESWFGYAELCLYLGHEAEYRRHRHALLARFASTHEPTIAERTARTCLLLPWEGAEGQQAAALVDRAVAEGQKHPWLAFFLASQGLTEYRRGHFARAIDLINRSMQGHVFMPGRLVLAMAQHRLGNVEEAQQTLDEAIRSYDWERLPDDHDGWICHVLRREAERLIVPHLDAFLEGRYQPRDNTERLALAIPCRYQRRYLAAAQLFKDAFAADPKLADELNTLHRYNAACHAALASSGQGRDAQHLGPQERARWRKLALDWLRSDLSAYAKLAATHTPENRKRVHQSLSHWLADPDLASIREPEHLRHLPEKEQQSWRQLWSDVKILLSSMQPNA